MIKKIYLLFLILFCNLNFTFSQEVNVKLINADKLFIKSEFAKAAEAYEDFLKTNAKDFYASRQTAICYTKINNPNKAIDYWPVVVDNSAATDADKAAYAKCLVANNRTDEAKKIASALLNSSNKEVANWAKSFGNANVFYEDSALCKIIEIKGINTDKSEFSPFVTKTELIYISEIQKRTLASLLNGGNKDKFYRIKSVEKKDSLNFLKPLIYNKQIQSKKMNGAVCITPDDSLFYYTKSASKADMKKSKNKKANYTLQLFYSRLNMFGDVHPEILPFLYNSTEYDCMQPSISKDGKKLYFVSNMPGTLGGNDIFVCEWEQGAWGKPKNVGPEINTSGNEVFPFITAEGILFFASDTRPGLGGLDVFFADPNTKTNSFYEAENSGATINTQYDDFGVFVNKNGKTGYLSSNRKNNSKDDDIFYFVNNKPKSFDVKIKFIDSLTNAPISTTFTLTTPVASYDEKLDSATYFTFRVKPTKEINVIANARDYKPKFFNKTIEVTDSIITITMSQKSQKSIKGKVIDKETNLPISGFKVAIYDENGNKYLESITDSTGNYGVTNLPVNLPLFIGSEKRPDYFSNTEKFFIRKDTDLVKNIYTQKIVVGKSIKVDNIYFDQGKFNIRADAGLELDKLVQLMKDNPDIIIELSSHTDCIGAAKANLALSDKRAKSSATYLISKGISKNRVKGKGYGESKLLNACACEGKVESKCSEDEMAVNRRSEFKVTGFIAKVPEAKPKKGKK